MEKLGLYLIGVIAAGIYCSILEAIGPRKGVNSRLIKTLCGVFLLLVAIRPITNLYFRDFNGLLPNFTEKGQSAAEQGTDFARQAWEAGIKQRVEAYILDKAASYGTQLEVEVNIKWTNTPIPAGVVISGAYSPYVKNQLSAIIERDLGIAVKDQQWRG